MSDEDIVVTGDQSGMRAPHVTYVVNVPQWSTTTTIQGSDATVRLTCDIDKPTSADDFPVWLKRHRALNQRVEEAVAKVLCEYALAREGK